MRFDIKRFYHLAESDNLDSILKRGLMSTKRPVVMLAVRQLGVAAPPLFGTELGLRQAGPPGVGHALLLKFCSNASSQRYRPI
jgi:hypothetical protein